MSEPTVDPAVEALAEALCEWWDEDVESHHAANLPCTGCLEIAKGVARRLPAHGVTLAADREPDGLRAAVEALAAEIKHAASDDWTAHSEATDMGDLDAANVHGSSAEALDEVHERLREALAAHPATDQEEARDA